MERPSEEESRQLLTRPALLWKNSSMEKLRLRNQKMSQIAKEKLHLFAIPPVNKMAKLEATYHQNVRGG